jgi:hypothetical protein
VTQQKKERFIEALSRTANVTAACEIVGLPRMRAYYWRSCDPVFCAGWDEALERGLDALEDEVMRRAKDGIAEPIYCKGRVVGETRRYSDRLAMFILKSRRPEVWGDRQRLDVKNDWSLLTEEELRRKAEELIEMIRELKEPPPRPPAVVYIAGPEGEIGS